MTMDSMQTVIEKNLTTVLLQCVWWKQQQRMANATFFSVVGIVCNEYMTGQGVAPEYPLSANLTFTFTICTYDKFSYKTHKTLTE